MPTLQDTGSELLDCAVNNETTKRACELSNRTIITLTVYLSKPHNPHTLKFFQHKSGRDAKLPELAPDHSLLASKT